MGIEEVTMYRIVCDGDECKASPQDDSDYYAWASVDGAELDADGADWFKSEDGSIHYCPDHQPKCVKCDSRLYSDEHGDKCDDCAEETTNGD